MGHHDISPEPRRTLPLYETVAHRIEAMIERGVYEPGDRLPSIRELHRERHISVNTAREVFRVLEARGVVEARAYSGHYVRRGPPVFVESDMEFPSSASGPVKDLAPDMLTRRVLEESARVGWVNLGVVQPPPELLPAHRLTEFTARAIRRHPRAAIDYAVPPGPPGLRQEIAKRVFRGGVEAGADRILVTAGCLEAVFVSLLSVCSAGDAVLIESPGFYLFYQLLARLGLNAIEIPSRPGTGIDPDALEDVLREAHRAGNANVAAALFITNFANPTGALIPEPNKRRIAAALERYGVHLVEDDLYGEMAWDVERPPSLSAYTDPTRTLLCSSFSKSIAPGYRIGWVVGSGALLARATHAKLATSSAISAPSALGITEFLTHGGYDRWLRAARRHYRVTVPAVREAIAAAFPAGTRSTRPAGGMVVWVAMPGRADASDLAERARSDRIVVAPGPMFSARGAYRSCLRINATTWNPDIERAIARLGEIASALCG
jgi:DNA-binding transcriptional MocR family regulator